MESKYFIFDQLLPLTKQLLFRYDNRKYGDSFVITGTLEVREFWSNEYVCTAHPLEIPGILSYLYIRTGTIEVQHHGVCYYLDEGWNERKF